MKTSLAFFHDSRGTLTPLQQSCINQIAIVDSLHIDAPPARLFTCVT